jgi:hypothetical protein
MIQLRKPRRVVVLILLLYSVTANAAFGIGWKCTAGPHLVRSGYSDGLPRHSFRLHHLILERAAIGPDGSTLLGHCCACSVSPLVKRGLSEHVASSTDRSDPTSLSAHKSSFVKGLDAPFPGRGHFFDRSPCEGNLELASISSVILLI